VTSPDPFFDIPRAERIAPNRSAFVVQDNLPVKPGHALVVMRRQIGNCRDATLEERIDLLAVVESVW
jgi:diadenosine tetraphosphate (Ap4A) HIT family hydrolase